jgi:hypothetical protein
MENFADLPQPETAPHIWLDPFTEESIPLVDAACDRWLKRRAELRRKRDERLADNYLLFLLLAMIVIVIIEGNNDGGAA